MSIDDNETETAPFLQRIQLIGRDGVVIRATGQVDDGAMRNCISTERWNRYAHCMTSLSPSKIRIGVANGGKVKPLGRWYGEIKVGGIAASDWFEVFDCKGAFDVILGKPWLQKVKGVHDYETDEIHIQMGEQHMVLENEETNPEKSTTLTRVEAVWTTEIRRPTSNRMSYFEAVRKEAKLEKRRKRDKAKLPPIETENTEIAPKIDKQEQNEDPEDPEHVLELPTSNKIPEQRYIVLDKPTTNLYKLHPTANTTIPTDQPHPIPPNTTQMTKEQNWPARTEWYPGEHEDELLAQEFARISLIHASNAPWEETRFAKYLTVEEIVNTDEEQIDTNEDKSETEEEETPPWEEWYQRRTATERQQEAAKEVIGPKRAQRTQKEEEHTTWAEHCKRRGTGIDSKTNNNIWTNDLTKATKGLEKTRESTCQGPPPPVELRRLDNTRYKEQWDLRRQAKTLGNMLQMNIGPVSSEEQLTSIVTSEIRIKRLHGKLDEMRAMVQDSLQDKEETRTNIYAMGDVRTDEFQINRGTNTTLRATDPFNPERIEQILSKIQIGADLTDQQRTKVTTLIREYADVFALSMSEVFFIDWWKHHLNVDPETKLPKRMTQRPLTEKQKDWFYKILDEMEEAHVIQKVPGEFLKCLNSTNLAPKEAGKTGITRTEVLRKVNAECIKHGLPPFWEEAIEPGETNEALLEAVEGAPGPQQKTTKWRVCHAFTALNKATQIPPFPHGDLKAKQEFSAGHRWASVIDFAAGYYAVPLDDESVPYTAFYVEGRGYFVYLRMPFGLTGAPSTFCEMVAVALEDMIGRELVSWMDDICLPGDVFETKLNNLKKFFERCRDKKLSLSPSKTKLFFTDVLFAGAMIGPSGIKPNLDKVGAVTNWPIPETVSELMGFLGLTNFFRRLIANYARIAAPLTDLTRNVEIQAPSNNWRARKGAYKRALKTTSIKNKWGPEQAKAFITLKCILSQEPLLKAPQYDGRVFRVTSDGSAEGFAGFLAQQFPHIEKDGKEVMRWHPIAFCSKRTSTSEAKYEPFLLEFAALKYCLDEFETYTYGSAIEIETDCQALRDCLTRERLTSHHSRWKESILARNIIDIRHRPGVENPVADGLSRMWTNRKRNNSDGSHWSVLADWEARTGITRDIMMTTDATDNTKHPLQIQFAEDIFFAPIVDHLLNLTAGETISERRRAAHRAKGFMIEDNKLWRVADSAARRVARTECIPAAEGFDTALAAHQRNGHFNVDSTKLNLSDRYFWPGMDTDCRQVMLECPRCKSFGPTTLNALLQPIRRTQPFALVAGDYLSLPKGKGGFKNVGLYIDVFSHFVWASKLKVAGSSKTTKDTLTRIFYDYAVPASFMADGGSHFRSAEVKQFCADHNVQHITTAPMAPWTNGLIEGSNQILLKILRRLCAPDHDFAEGDIDPNDIPQNWPDHLDEAIRQMNDRILLSLNVKPRELLFGRTFRPETTTPESIQPTTPEDVDIHFALAETMRWNAHLLSLKHADRQANSFNNNSKIVEFNIGDIVQWYNSTADDNHKSINKLAPRWSGPVQIYARFLNSFSLCDLNGVPLKYQYKVHSRRLRHYIPLRGSPLDLKHPRDTHDYTPTQLDLEIADAEERMADTLNVTGAPPGNTL